MNFLPSATLPSRSPQYTRPWLYEAQRQFVDSPARYTIVEASTKVGKTVSCLIWLFEQALKGKPGNHFWWVAPIYSVAGIAFERLKRWLHGSGLRLQDWKANETKQTIEIAGRIIEFKGADRPDTLYGQDVHAAVIDEASRCKEESWHAVRSTLTATNGRLKIIGNVRGRKNWAFQLARKAEAGSPDMAYFRLTAWDAVAGGVLTAAEVEDAKRNLPDSVYKELYLAEPSDDGGNPFGISAIKACIDPMTDAAPVAWGWDLGKSVDWTVGIGIDADGHVCRFERWNKTQLPPGIPGGMDYWEATIARIRALTGQTPALVDSTGAGDPILEGIAKGRPLIDGYQFTNASKQRLMEGLAVAIQQRKVTFPDGAIRVELDAFEYEFGRTGTVFYSAPEGQHDDCVCSLALAVSRFARPRLNLDFSRLKAATG